MNIQILKGSLLGDMWIQKFKDRPNSYSVDYVQSELEYAEWKAQMCGVPYTIKRRDRFDERTNKTNIGYCVHLTLDKKIKKSLYDSFYTPVKEVTNELLYSLSPLSIAIWYMDDGNLYYNGNNCHLTLSTNSFNSESLNNIINYFRDVYNLNFKLTKQNAIRLTSVKETKKFMLLVEKFIPKCMFRKTLKYQKNRYNKQLSDERKKFRNKRYT